MNVLYFSNTHLSGGRRMSVLVSEEFFGAWWTTSKPDEWRTLQCTKGLPDGARLVGLTHEPERRQFRFLFEHESVMGQFEAKK